VNIILIGDGVSKAGAIKQVNDSKISNVFFLPRVPMCEIGSLLEKADILLVHLTDNELFTITVPSRTQAYLAMGKPIIMGVNGDAAYLIEKSKSGICCQPNSSTSLADAIEQMVLLPQSEREMMGDNAKYFYNEELSLNKGVDKFISVFEAVK
jgi:colanic acid biosynthesis glycosyl transferase WcaI